MSLRPCPACRRHVAATATACVFCAAALIPAAARAITVAARASRAAVFAAGAALAIGACAAPSRPIAAPAGAGDPASPGDPAGPADPVDVHAAGPSTGAFATPPPGDGRGAAPVATTGAIEVLFANSLLHQEHLHATLITPAGAWLPAKVDETYTVRFRDLPPGAYRVVHPEVTHTHRGVQFTDDATVNVTVVAGAVAQVVVHAPPPPPPRDPHQQAMPYGAPPARHRVV